jgi:hypothetical protein
MNNMTTQELDFEGTNSQHTKVLDKSMEYAKTWSQQQKTSFRRRGL